MKGKYLGQTAAVLTAFTASCIMCCWFFSGINIFDLGIGERLTGAAGKDIPVIVIDAGHGGMDGGASSPGGIQEKDINLSIAEKLAETAQAYGAEVIMTRDSDRGLILMTARLSDRKKGKTF